jgi:hypothetical protein
MFFPDLCPSSAAVVRAARCALAEQDLVAPAQPRKALVGQTQDGRWSGRAPRRGGLVLDPEPAALLVSFGLADPRVEISKRAPSWA